MADVKKPDKKEVKPAPKDDPFVEIVSLLAIGFFILYILNGFINMFNQNGLLSNGLQGLTPQGIMLRHTRPINSLANAVGTRVVTMSDSTKVYDSPGGKEIGSQPFNARGKILQGYVEIKGERYWYVDFDKGSDGWVKESDIAYLESEPNLAERIIMWVFSVLPLAKFFMVIFSLGLILFIAYIVMKLTEIRKNQHELIYPNVISEEDMVVNPKWEKILTCTESLNESDWKLAIIEADIMLSDILDKLQLPGDTMGDKMKAVEKSDFNTIDLAWEAHKIRNQIAHEGSDFELNQHEVKRVVGLYKAVFEEFQII